MAERCLRDWFCLFDVHLDEGRRPSPDQPQQSDFNTPDVMHEPFIQVTIWILYITVPSHTIKLPRVFMSLSILKGYMGCKRSWCPSEIRLLIILGHSNVKEVHALCSFVCVCVSVHTHCFPTEENKDSQRDGGVKQSVSTNCPLFKPEPWPRPHSSADFP